MQILPHKKSLRPFIFFSIFLISTFLHACATISGQTYPSTGWQFSTPEEQGMRSSMLAEMITDIKTNGYRIDSVSIIRNGQMVLDAYFWPFAKDERHIIHSCTKSVMSALIGIAIDKGYIKSVKQPITDFFQDRTIALLDNRKKEITLENLLTMTTGLDCRDSYLYDWKGLFAMRYSPDWAQYVLDLPMVTEPGAEFEYCNGASYLLSDIIQNTTGMKTLAFARTHLFEPLAITDIGWDTSPQGIYIGWGEMYLKPHDMAKIGWLYLNKGRWNGKRIMPEKWVEESTRGHIDATLFDQYGYQWWVDAAGYYMAVGYKGQFIFVVPQKNLVAAFTGDLIGRSFKQPKKMLDNYIIPAAVSAESLPPDPAQSTHLVDLVTGVAKAPVNGYIWKSEKDGAAKDGVFKRTAMPSFQFEFPPTSKKVSLDPDAPGQIMRMKTPSDAFFSVTVDSIPEGVALQDFGVKVYSPRLSSVGSKIKVVSNEAITLKCGTPAYRTDITWMWRDYISITTFLVSAYKDGKVVFVSAHPWKEKMLAKPIVQSLTFK